jgi:Xaa-Pro aminopeptidase
MYRVAGQAPMGRQLVHLLRQKKATSGPVGIVGLATIMPVEDYVYVQKELPGVELRDVTPAFSAVKGIKSKAEVGLIEETYEIADAGFKCFEEHLAVGKTEWEVCGQVEGLVRRRGVLQSYIMSQHGEQYPRCATARTYREEDLIACFVEIIGPNGCWVEKGSTFAFPKATAQARGVADNAFRSLAAVERALRPGEPVQSAFRAARDAGHGVGVDHDVPILGDDDASPIEVGMVVAAHPHIVDPSTGTGAVFCEQYLITPDGPRRFSRYAPEFRTITR